MTQQEALNILKTGANVFLTGEPGSGKTHTINTYVAWLREHGVEHAITASTGIAATHIGGLTIHSWSGIGIRRDLNEYDLDRISQNSRVDRRINDARVLIIDEVSMLSARTLSMVDMVCREIRQSKEVFGGLQVILVGDFFQLPPVSSRNDDEQQTLIESKPLETFAYHSDAWKELNMIICYLSEQHRQEDKTFLELLTAMRRATVTDTHLSLLRKRYAKEARDGITQLYSHNADVDHINNRELSKLSSEPRVFIMEDKGPENMVSALKRGCLSPETLSLKIGANVMFTKNDTIRRRYANGTLGVVVGFDDDDRNLPIIKTKKGEEILAEPDEWHVEDGGKVLARITQVPLRLAWAITVHKSQGMSLDAAHMDLGDSFEYGQGYVAISRVRTLEGLTLSGLNKRALEVHPEILEKDIELRSLSSQAKESFAKISEEELFKMHNNFVRATKAK